MKIVVFAKQATFIDPILAHWKDKHEIRIAAPPTVTEMRAAMQWADLAWFEFCDELAIQGTNQPKVCKFVVRLHSYEVFTDMITKVRWSKVDKLIFVNEKIKEVFLQRISDPPPIEVIHNGVDTTKFTIPKNKDYGKKIASIGFINYKKNPQLMLYCLKKIHEYDPDYVLHVAGTHQDVRTHMYMEHYIKRNELPVVYEGWIEDIPAWLKDKDFVISTSLMESFHYSVAESMLSGVMPLIHHWPGAEMVYPREFLFEDPDECLELIKNFEGKNRSKTAKKNRKYIIEHYDLVKQAKKLEEALPEEDVVNTDLKSGITLVVIARDEEKGIGKLIDSVKDAMTDMVVHVDSETTDKTAEIAEEHGARVFPYTWTDDFGAARNEITNRVETEWVLMIDGHEYLESDPQELVDAIEKHPTAGSIDISVHMESGEVHKSNRLYRKEAAVWKKPAHNYLEVNGLEADASHIMLIHDREEGQTPESRKRRNIQRDIHLVRMLTRNIMDNVSDTRSMFYLGQQHRDGLRWEAAYYWYERYNRTREGHQWDEELFQAAVGAARAAQNLKDYDKAGKAAGAAVQYDQSRAEGWALLGNLSYDQNQFDKAYDCFKKASECEPPKDKRLWVDVAMHKGGWKIHDLIAMACWHMGRFDEGVKHCKTALEASGLPKAHKTRIEENLKQHTIRLKGGEKFSTAAYWESRYTVGGTSGDGSYGRLADYKADAINQFVEQYEIQSVLDHGSGDGNQASLYNVPKYVGYDVAPAAVKLAREKNPDKTFVLLDDLDPKHKAELGISMDVLFHLIEDEVYEAHLTKLFDSSTRFVIVYSPNTEDPSQSAHIRYRKFTDWVKENKPEWELVKTIENSYPYHPKLPTETSLSNFYIFAKKNTEG